MCNQLRAHTFCFYVWSTCTALEETWSHKRGPAETCFVFNHCLFWFLSSSTFFIPTFDFHFSVFFWGGGGWVGGFCIFSFAIVVDLSFLPNSLGKTHRKKHEQDMENKLQNKTANLNKYRKRFLFDFGRFETWSQMMTSLVHEVAGAGDSWWHLHQWDDTKRLASRESLWKELGNITSTLD